MSFTTNARLLGGYVACRTLSEEQVMAALLQAARENGYAAQYGEAEAKRTISDGIADGAGSPLPIIDADDVQQLSRAEGEVSSDSPKMEGLTTFLKPFECEALAAQPYVIKGLLAEGNVDGIIGDPGSAKSLIGPHLGYAVAQGREAFSMRTRQGRYSISRLGTAGPRFSCSASMSSGAVRTRITPGRNSTIS